MNFLIFSWDRSCAAI